MLGRPFELARLERLGAERFDDAMAGDGLGADVGHLFEGFLAAPSAPAYTLPEPHQRIDDEWGSRQAQDRETRIVVEEKRPEADQGQGLTREVADRFRDDALYLTDVARDPRHQPPRRLL